MKDIRRILSVALLTLFLGTSLISLTFGHAITLTLNSSPITGVNVWYEASRSGVSGGPYSTNTAIPVESSDQGPPPFGHGSYKIMYELYPTGYILTHFVINGTEIVGFKQEEVHCVLGPVTVGYLRVSLFGDTTIEGIYEPIQFGPKIDKLRFKVIKSPDAQLIAMQTCEVDVLTDLIRTGDIEKLDSDGFTITAAPGFHMGHIAFNIRTNQEYKDPAHGSPIAGPVLGDVNFRHALFHAYNQEEIVASIYKYIVTPVQSLVPPAQGGWVNPNVPKHPYNPGDPTATTEYNPATGDNADSCSILRYGGYTWNVGEGKWYAPALGDYLPSLLVWTPTYEVAPTSAEHGARFVADCNAIGIPLVHDPREFSPYLDLVFGAEDVPGGEFDIYMVFWSLGRFPDHLYDMTHSSFDVRDVPGSYNSPGIHSDELDTAVETIKFSLDHAEKMEAAYHAQEMLYDEAYPECAFSYMQLYSRIYFNAFKPGMEGIVNSPGYGSDNTWTLMNMHWEEEHPNERFHEIYTDKNLIIWCLGEEPENFNPCAASTVYAWAIISPTVSGLMRVNPYTHKDLGDLCWNWEIEGWAEEYEVDELLAGEVIGSNWHEDWPRWSRNWNLNSWHDVPPLGQLNIGDQVDFEGDPNEYRVNDFTWDIKVENKKCPYPEMKLSGTGAPRPPTPILAGVMPGTMWHEEWPTRSTMWTVNAFTDNGDGVLSRSDQIQMSDDSWWHVDSVTVTLHLLETPVGEIDVKGEYVGTGDGTTTIYALDHAPVKPNSETVYFDGNAQSTGIYTMDYPAGEITFNNPPSLPVTNEYVGTGDGTTKVFDLDRPPLKENSETIYVNDEEVYPELYDIDYVGGVITFVVAPLPTLVITADYTTYDVGITADYTRYDVGITADYTYTYTPDVDKVVEFAGTGMKLVYWIRDDVYWQDGNQYTAQDARFNILFFRDNEIPRYRSGWDSIVDVDTVGYDGEDHFKLVVYLNATSQFLIYDVAGMAALLPPPVWAPLNGIPLAEILQYAPEDHTETPVGAGPWFGETDPAGQPIGAVNHLYGTGPFIFEYYDPVGMYAEMHAFRRYYKATQKVQGEKAEMFHAIGDVDWNGEVGIFDLSRQGRAYGYFDYETEFDAQADVNQDGIVDMRDITMTSFFWGDKKEYP